MPEFFEKVKKRLKKTADGMRDVPGRRRTHEKRQEGEGFEPSIRNFRMPPFQGGTFNHSATLP